MHESAVSTGRSFQMKPFLMMFCFVVCVQSVRGDLSSYQAC